MSHSLELDSNKQTEPEGANNFETSTVSRAVASAIADSKTTGKNHPNFTVVIRKQVPFDLEEYSVAALGGVGGGHFEAVQEKVEGNLESIRKQDLNQPEEETEGSNELPLVSNPDPDFTFRSAWQFWELEDPKTPASNNPKENFNRLTSEWNVRRLGPLLTTGRQFWTAYRALYHSSNASSPPPKNLMLFRNPIEPKWEHPANVGGGRWFFDVSYNHRKMSGGNGAGGFKKGEDTLFSTNYWTQTMEAVISGALDDEDADGDDQNPMVVGLILNFKPLKYRVSLWLRGGGQKRGVSGEKLREVSTPKIPEEEFSEVVALGNRLRDLLSLRCVLKFEQHCTDFGSK